MNDANPLKSVTCKSLEDFDPVEREEVRRKVVDLEHHLDIKHGQCFVLMIYEQDKMPGAAVDIISSAQTVHEVRSVCSQVLTKTQSLAIRESN